MNRKPKMPDLSTRNYIHNEITLHGFSAALEKHGYTREDILSWPFPEDSSQKERRTAKQKSPQSSDKTPKRTGNITDEMIRILELRLAAYVSYQKSIDLPCSTEEISIEGQRILFELTGKGSSKLSSVGLHPSRGIFPKILDRILKNLIPIQEPVVIKIGQFHQDDRRTISLKSTGLNFLDSASSLPAQAINQKGIAYLEKGSKELFPKYTLTTLVDVPGVKCAKELVPIFNVALKAIQQVAEPLNRAILERLMPSQVEEPSLIAFELVKNGTNSGDREPFFLYQVHCQHCPNVVKEESVPPPVQTDKLDKMYWSRCQATCEHNHKRPLIYRDRYSLTQHFRAQHSSGLSTQQIEYFIAYDLAERLKILIDPNLVRDLCLRPGSLWNLLSMMAKLRTRLEHFWATSDGAPVTPFSEIEDFASVSNESTSEEPASTIPISTEPPPTIPTSTEPASTIPISTEPTSTNSTQTETQKIDSIETRLLSEPMETVSNGLEHSNDHEPTEFSFTQSYQIEPLLTESSSTDVQLFPDGASLNQPTQPMEEDFTEFPSMEPSTEAENNNTNDNYGVDENRIVLIKQEPTYEFHGRKSLHRKPQNGIALLESRLGKFVTKLKITNPEYTDNTLAKVTFIGLTVITEEAQRIWSELVKTYPTLKEPTFEYLISFLKHFNNSKLQGNNRKTPISLRENPIEWDDEHYTEDMSSLVENGMDSTESPFTESYPMEISSVSLSSESHLANLSVDSTEPASTQLDSTESTQFTSTDSFVTESSEPLGNEASSTDVYHEEYSSNQSTQPIEPAEYRLDDVEENRILIKQEPSFEYQSPKCRAPKIGMAELMSRLGKFVTQLKITYPEIIDDDSPASISDAAMEMVRGEVHRIWSELVITDPKMKMPCMDILKNLLVLFNKTDLERNHQREAPIPPQENQIEREDDGHYTENVSLRVQDEMDSTESPFAELYHTESSSVSLSRGSHLVEHSTELFSGDSSSTELFSTESIQSTTTSTSTTESPKESSTEPTARLYGVNEKRIGELRKKKQRTRLPGGGRKHNKQLDSQLTESLGKLKSANIQITYGVVARESRTIWAGLVEQNPSLAKEGFKGSKRYVSRFLARFNQTQSQGEESCPTELRPTECRQTEPSPESSSTESSSVQVISSDQQNSHENQIDPNNPLNDTNAQNEQNPSEPEISMPVKRGRGRPRKFDTTAPSHPNNRAAIPPEERNFCEVNLDNLLNSRLRYRGLNVMSHNPQSSSSSQVQPRQNLPKQPTNIYNDEYDSVSDSELPAAVILPPEFRTEDDEEVMMDLDETDSGTEADYDNSNLYQISITRAQYEQKYVH